MSKYFLWSIDNNGYVFSLSSWDNCWNYIDSSVSKIKKFKVVAGSSWCVWSVGIDNELYIYIPKSDIIIKSPEIIIENQRKSSGFFSHRNLLDSDPFSFTTPNYYGKLLKTNLDSFNLPSSRWKWEDEWKIKIKFNGQFTNEGWVYSSNFLRKFQVERYFLSSNVRRRYWQRYRYFHAFDRWLYIGQDVQPFEISCSQDCCPDSETTEEYVELNESGVLDVGCGGEMLPHQKDGFLAVWIINANGQILFRLNIHRQNPEGSYWCHVKMQKHVKAVSLSVGPLGNLLICTSYGEIYFRENITWKNPIGTSWKSLPLPRGLWKNEQIIQVSMSIYSIWARSTLGRLWLRTNVNLHEVRASIGLGDSWNLMATDIQFISVCASEQLFMLPNDGNCVLYRLNKSVAHTLGKHYSTGKIPLHFNESADRKSETLIAISSSGLFLENDVLPINWVPSPAASHKIYQRSSGPSSGWKISILISLKNRDNSEFKNPKFSNYTSPFEQTFWSKGSECQIECFSTDISRNIWSSASVVLHHKIRNNFTCSTLHLNVRHTEIFRTLDCIPFYIESSNVICLSKHHSNYPLVGVLSSERCSMMIIFVKTKTFSQSSKQPNTSVSRMLLKFSSETDVEDWIMALNFVSFDRTVVSDKSSTGKAWFLNKYHEPFSSPINQFRDAFNIWNQDGGHFAMIKSGAKGCITWAIGFNGVPWVHTRGWGGSYLGPLCSSKEHLHPVSDTRSIFVIEYQKVKPLSGGMSRTFETYMWTDEFGNVIRHKDSFQPLSWRWQWLDEWCVFHNKSTENLKSDGWEYSTGLHQKFDDKLTWNKNFRRRTWSRTYKTSIMGPWKDIINSLKIIDISIFPGIDYHDEKNHLVLVITKKNNLFMRKGVTINNPGGLTWTPIRSELKMISVSVNSNGSVWVVCIYGFIWRLKLTNIRIVTKLNERDWEKVEHAHVGMKFKEVASGDDRSIWAVDSDDRLWVRQFDSDVGTASAGVRWIHVCDGVVHVSCASQRLVFAVMSDGRLGERVGVTRLLPQGTNWNIKLDEIVSHVCIHGA